jgi:hypothetical protein
MATQKPPNTASSSTGFPWRIFWETLAPECESICDVESDDAAVAYKGLCAQLEAAGRSLPSFSRDKVAMLVEASQGKSPSCDVLIDRLYRVGAAYLVAKLEMEHGLGSSDAKTHATAVARSAAQLLNALATMDLDVLLALFVEQRFTRWTRQGSEPEEQPPNPQTLSHLIYGLMDLADGAKDFADNIPTSRQGRSVDVFGRRLIRDAAHQIRAAGLVPITFSMSSNAPVSAGAKLLFNYLKSLNRQISGQTVRTVLTDLGLHTSRPRGRPRQPK